MIRYSEQWTDILRRGKSNSEKHAFLLTRRPLVLLNQRFLLGIMQHSGFRNHKFISEHRL